MIALGRSVNRSSANMIEISYGFMTIYVRVLCRQNGHFNDTGLRY